MTSPAPRASFRSAPFGLPGHAWAMWGFGAFNAVNWSIALGTPMVLTARLLGARETMIGGLLALPPLLVVAQVAAAGYADRRGHKRLMLAGWSARSWLLLGMAPLPLLAGRVAPAVPLAALTLLLLAFNLLRGFTSGAWLPWLAYVMPEEKRGRYLGMEHLFINSGAAAALLLTGVLLGRQPAPWRYGLMFVIGWLAGQISLFCLRAVPAPAPAAAAAAPRPAAELRRRLGRIWGRRPFRRVTRTAAAFAVAVTAAPGFLVVYLRDAQNIPPDILMWLSALSTLGSLAAALVCSRLADRMGSRPLIRMAGALFSGLMLCWAVAAWNRYPVGAGVAAALFFLSGAAVTMLAVPQARLVLAYSPPRELTLALALNQTIISLGAAAASFVWGGLLEWGRRAADAGANLNPFGIFFVASAALCLGAQAVALWMPEPGAQPVARLLNVLFMEWPARALNVIWLPDEKRPKND